MDLRTYIKGLPDEAARIAFAEKCETTIGHLRNVMGGHSSCATDLAVLIERHSAGAVKRPDLRPDWRRHWPELIKSRRVREDAAAKAA